MKMNKTRSLAAALLIATIAAVPSLADEPSQDEMMQAYMEAAQPGEHHAYLAEKAGQWNCTVRSWMDPEGEPMVSEGSEESRMVLGGRYLESEFSGSMMGMPFQGRGLMGYDNAKQQYVGVWYDSMGTGIMYFHGNYDPQEKALVCHGEYVDPVTKQTQKSTTITRDHGPDHTVFEMWGPGPTGEDVKWMEIEYARAE